MGTETELSQRHCKPCEGTVSSLQPDELRRMLEAAPCWALTQNGTTIRREWRMKDFAAAMDFFNRVGQIAESEDHHPDLHLTNYRNVVIELSTHAIGGLSENDFILATRIDQLPVELKAGSVST